VCGAAKAQGGNKQQKASAVWPGRKHRQIRSKKKAAALTARQASKWLWFLLVQRLWHAEHVDHKTRCWGYGVAAWLLCVWYRLGGHEILTARLRGRCFLLACLSSGSSRRQQRGACCLRCDASLYAIVYGCLSSSMFCRHAKGKEAARLLSSSSCAFCWSFLALGFHTHTQPHIYFPRMGQQARIPPLLPRLDPRLQSAAVLAASRNGSTRLTQQQRWHRGAKGKHAGRDYTLLHDTHDPCPGSKTRVVPPCQASLQTRTTYIHLLLPHPRLGPAVPLV